MKSCRARRKCSFAKIVGDVARRAHSWWLIDLFFLACEPAQLFGARLAMTGATLWHGVAESGRPSPRAAQTVKARAKWA